MIKHQFVVRKAEKGYVLIASLIFLLIITLLAISGISGNLIQTHLAANALDAQISFETAEQVLAQAQGLVMNGSSGQFSPVNAGTLGSQGPTQGFYFTDANTPPVWTNQSFWTNSANYIQMSGVSYTKGADPHAGVKGYADGAFAVELLSAQKTIGGAPVLLYRITAFATGLSSSQTGLSGNAPTVLQTVVAVPMPQSH